jgi:hypothetical protein
VPIDADVRRLALGALLLGLTGPTPPRWLLDALADGLGGVVLFSSNLRGGSRVRQLTDALRAAAGRDVVIALDEERGDVTRVDAARGSASPGAAALGYLDDVAATEETYAAVGGRLKSAGVTLRARTGNRCVFFADSTTGAQVNRCPISLVRASASVSVSVSAWVWVSALGSAWVWVSALGSVWVSVTVLGSVCLIWAGPKLTESAYSMWVAR